MRRRAKNAGRAEAALQGMVVHERALQFIERTGLRQALDTDDIGTIRLYCVLRAAAHRPPIDQDRAGAADAMLATDMDAIGLQLVAEKVAEQHARFGFRRPPPPPHAPRT